MSGKNNSVTGCLIERKGKYYVVVSYYVDGHRMQDTKSTGIAISSHKKREAERIKDSLIHEKEKELEQAAVAKTSHSFADCFERWIDYKSAQTESTTAWGYKSKSKSIIKYFRDKNTMIEGLKPKDVFAYYEWALEEGRQQVYNENMPKGLSRRTVRDQSTLIKGFLNDAVVQGIISINPADKAEVPRVKENNTKETAYMDAEQAEAFLNFVKSDKHFKKLYCISKLGLYYGFRRSEILGLKWSAIDFEKGEIVINHTVVRGINGVEYRDNVKTESSHRYLPLLELVKIARLEM
ncbi:MAG: tyrosine-type recombinase/integrase, partial [Lachnospiraceae bacterium]|nr:tyrosine-type recombinase/integrase [Lachnospiraceae bacterium]